MSAINEQPVASKENPHSIDFFEVTKSLLAKIMVADRDGKVVYVNDRWSEYTGIDLAAAATGAWKDAVDARDRARLLGQWEHAREIGSLVEVELRLLHTEDHAIRWHVCRINAIFDASGKIKHWCAMFADIHDQKLDHAGLQQHLGEQSRELADTSAKLAVVTEVLTEFAQARDEAAEGLRAADAQLAREREFSQMAEAIPQIVWTARRDAALDYFNMRWYDYTGLPFEATHVCDWNTILHPDDRQKREEIWQRSLTNGEPFEIECRLLRGCDQTYRWHLDRALPIRNDRSEIIKWFGTWTDIHDQILAQEEAVDLSLKLQKSEAWLRQLAEAVPEVVWTANPAGYMEYFNQRWYDYTGQSVERSVGWGWQECLHPDEVVPHEKVWRDAVATGISVQLEQRVRGRDGHYRWFLCRAVPSRDETGKVVKWFGTLTDIKDHKQTSEALEQRVQDRTMQLKRMAQKHEEASAELQSLAYTISHELQSPLKTITSDLGLLAVRYKGRLGSDADEFIGNCVDAAQKTQRMVDDLWIYARIDRPETVVKPVSMAEAFDKAIQTLKEQIEKHNAAVTRDENLPTIEGNPDQLQYLLSQLIENAVTFNSNPIPTVHVAVQRKGAEWFFSLKDNGIGFDMIEAIHIFKMFVRLRKDYPGTGMGLAICKKITTFHGGNIWVESRPSLGSTFFFSMPAG